MVACTFRPMTPAQKANLVAAQKMMMAETVFPHPFAVCGFVAVALDRLAQSA